MLFVEDAFDQALRVKAFLPSAGGYEVTHSPDGAQAGALLKPGGRILLPCASAYRAEITPEEHWLGATAREGIDAPFPPEQLRALLSGRHPLLPHLRYRILDDREALEWLVYPSDSSRIAYSLHALVAEKAET